MGGDEVNKFDELLEALLEFNPNLPSPIHCPVEFQYHLKLFKYYQSGQFEAIMNRSN
jgi:hypothetical protein